MPTGIFVRKESTYEPNTKLVRDQKTSKGEARSRFRLAQSSPDKELPKTLPKVKYGEVINKIHLAKILGEFRKGSCIECGKQTGFNPYLFSPSLFCSTKCVSSCEITKQKKIDASLERYGVEHTLSSPEVRKKGRESMLRTLGVYHQMKCPKFREGLEERSLAKNWIS